MKHERHPEDRNLGPVLALAFAVGVIVMIIGAGATTQSVITLKAHASHVIIGDWFMIIGVIICISAGLTSYYYARQKVEEGKRG